MKNVGEIEFHNSLPASLAGLTTTTTFPTTKKPGFEGRAEFPGRVGDAAVCHSPTTTPGNEWSKTNQSERTPMKDIVEIEFLNPLSTSLADQTATPTPAERPGLEGGAELTRSEGVGNPGPSGHSSEDACAHEGITSESVQVQTPSASEGPAPSTDAADLPDDRAVADDTTEAKAPQPSEHSLVADSTAESSSLDEPMSDEEQAVPRLSKQAMESLLDELTAELVALEAFGREVDDRARENEWFGKHTELSQAVFRAELVRTGKYTFNVDGNGVLLDDPVKYRLALEVGAQITLRVHRGLSEAKKSHFILLTQGRERVRTEAENRELKRRIILAGLVQGLTYEATAELASVSPNTVRNFEKRAAADPNSKLEITQRPDGRFKPETQEKIAEAARLRKEGKSNADIAESLGTDVEAVGKWLKDACAPDKAKSKAGGDKGKKTAGTKPAQPIEDIAARDGVPELHRRALERLGLDTRAYIDRLKDRAIESRKEIEAVSEIDDLLNLSLCYSLGLAFADLRLRKMLSGGDEIDVDEAVPRDDSSRHKAGPAPDTILLGPVMAIEPPKVFVALPIGGGVIDNRDDCLEWHAPLKEDEVIRVRVEGFDSKRGLWKLDPAGRQTPAPALGAVAAGSDRDDRCSPNMKLAGLKAGPKEKEVIL
jgi:DNA-binding CsgD family transcriptional regulator